MGIPKRPGRQLKIKRLFAMALIGASCLVAGCTSQFRTVNFCWSSDFYLVPDERMIETDRPVLETKKLLMEWIKSHNGRLIADNTSPGSPVSVTAENRKNYEVAHNLALKEWDAYKINDFDKRTTPEEFAQMKESILATKTLADKTDVTTISAMFSDDARHFSFERSTGGVDWGKTLTSGMLTNQIYVKQEHAEVTIKSRLDFLLFERDGKTHVYATGHPVEGTSEAGFGKSIGYNWWPYVSGSEETMMVMDALHALKQ